MEVKYIFFSMARDPQESISDPFLFTIVKARAVSKVFEMLFYSEILGLNKKMRHY